MKKVTCFADFGVPPSPPEHLTPEEKAQWWLEFDLAEIRYLRSLNLPHADSKADFALVLMKCEDRISWKKA
jgi:hypothetical protein